MFYLNLVAWLLAVTALLNFSIGSYVYRRGPRSAQNRAFGAMATTISLWTTAVAFAHYGSSGHVWFVRFAFASASLIPLFVLALVDNLFIERPAALRRWLFTPFGILLCIACFSDWLVASVTPQPPGS